MLRGRRSECEVLDRLLEAVGAGESRALVIRGESGVGKTALLEYLVGRASGRVVRAAGVQSEMELAFAGLHQLCAPMLGRAESLPGHQRDALRTALGLRAGPAPDRLLVGLAVLGLFAEVARKQPLVCVVDDAQWLDRASAQALAFVARRLGAESVAMVFAARTPGEIPNLTGLTDLPGLDLAGLPDDDARALLRSALRGPMDEQVVARIVAETRGNPLALLELPHGSTPTELVGGSGMKAARALPGRIEESYLQRVAQLPSGTRQLLLVAAAEPIGDPVLVWRAAARLGIGAEAASPAAAVGLLEIGAQVRFRHPLVRSAVYRAASPEERRIAHRVLADVTDAEADPDRRAWNRAQAAPRPDEDVAAELECSAGRARARGGPAAAAAFLERAVELTLEPARRAERALAAARDKHHAALPDAALGLISLAEAGPLDELQRARASLLRAQIAFAVNRRGCGAPALLLTAAEQLEALDLRLARATCLEALSAAMFAGGGGVREVAEFARSMPRPSPAEDAADLLLEGLAVRSTDGPGSAMPIVERALAAFRSPDLPDEVGLRWFWLACRTARDLWDHETWDVLATRHVRLARDAGALTALPLALSMRISVHTFAGELAAASSLLDEAEAVTAVTGCHLDGALLLTAWQGREAAVHQRIEAMGDAHPGEETAGLTVGVWARMVIHNGRGRHQDAMAAASHAEVHLSEEGMSACGVLIELVEAAARTGAPERASDALRRLTETTRSCGTDWALGIEARSRALVTEHDSAERHYREAIERLGRTRVRGELARAHLLYGEWLRRDHRRVDAREQLGTAYEMFTTMGAEAFAERAARELRAIGEPVPGLAFDTTAQLTTQETQIVRLVCEDLTNSQIAARLFLSPRTVEWHLTKIFGKLNITSRKHLRG
ncbi:helix-turn-helix transcriptional regulator [Pseudonocardia sp. CA-142604]|uniref:helix-turn-helix transcriptional regulator n=1 Tax=Pseudonocardia sp. CA-142604 TaxID=3240024 RepID=UPI003D939D4E